MPPLSLDFPDIRDDPIVVKLQDKSLPKQELTDANKCQWQTTDRFKYLKSPTFELMIEATFSVHI